MNYYQNTIRETLAKAGHIGQYDPRHVEAVMRCNVGTLDGFSPSQFSALVLKSLWEVRDLGDSMNERLAASYGL